MHQGLVQFNQPHGIIYAFLVDKDLIGLLFLPPGFEDREHKLPGDYKPHQMNVFILVGVSKHPTSQSVLFWALMFLYIVTLGGNSMIIFLIGVTSQLSNLSWLDLLFSTSAVP